MSRQFTDPSGRRWRVDTHRAGDGRLEFTAKPQHQVRRSVSRFLISVLIIDALVILVVATLAEGRDALNSSLSAAVTGLLIGTIASGLALGLTALLRLRSAPEPLVFSAPFALRADLNDAELSKAVQAAERMRDYPDDTGPIDMRASITLAIRSENPPSRLAR